MTVLRLDARDAKRLLIHARQRGLSLIEIQPKQPGEFGKPAVTKTVPKPIRRISKKRRKKLEVYGPIRKSVLERDHWQCLLCGWKLSEDGRIRTRPPEVHHIIVFRSQCGKDEAANLASLCYNCHKMAHGIRASVVREMLQERIAT